MDNLSESNSLELLKIQDKEILLNKFIEFYKLKYEQKEKIDLEFITTESILDDMLALKCNIDTIDPKIKDIVQLSLIESIPIQEQKYREVSKKYETIESNIEQLLKEINTLMKTLNL